MVYGWETRHTVVFLSTLPAKGATCPGPAPIHWRSNFYPRSPRGERQLVSRLRSTSSSFLSTLPARGATELVGTLPRERQFLSTLPARGATGNLAPGHRPAEISIHAPREGSDVPQHLRCEVQQHFYPRSPRGERLVLPAGGQQKVDISIHAPREGSDHQVLMQGGQTPYFYPRSPRGERPPSPRRNLTLKNFYPRSPRGERPSFSMLSALAKMSFLSTLPARGATSTAGLSGWSSTNFYPRSPRGERRATLLDRADVPIFLSTLPARGATSSLPGWRLHPAHFYPRSPRGERRVS